MCSGSREGDHNAVLLSSDCILRQAASRKQESMRSYVLEGEESIGCRSELEVLLENHWTPDVCQLTCARPSSTHEEDFISNHAEQSHLSLRCNATRLSSPSGEMKSRDILNLNWPRTRIPSETLFLFGQSDIFARRLAHVPALHVYHQCHPQSSPGILSPPALRFQIGL